MIRGYKTEARTQAAADALENGEYVNSQNIPDMNLLHEELERRGIEPQYYVENYEGVEGGRIQLYKFHIESDVTPGGQPDVTQHETSDTSLDICESSEIRWPSDYDNAMTEVDSMNELFVEATTIPDWSQASAELLEVRERMAQEKGVSVEEISPMDVTGQILHEQHIAEERAQVLSGDTTSLTEPNKEVYDQLTDEQKEHYVEALVENNAEILAQGQSDPDLLQERIQRAQEELQARFPEVSSEEIEKEMLADPEVAELVQEMSRAALDSLLYDRSEVLKESLEELDPKALDKYSPPSEDNEKVFDEQSDVCQVALTGVNGGPVQYAINKDLDQRLESTSAIKLAFNGEQSAIMTGIFNNNNNTDGYLVDARENQIQDTSDTLNLDGMGVNSAYATTM